MSASFRGGRPRKDRHSIRRKINVYVSPEEQTKIDSAARLACLDRSTYIREVTLGYDVKAPPSLFDREGLELLRRAGGLLNQAMHSVHRGELDRRIEFDIAHLLKLQAATLERLLGRSSGDR